MRARVGVREPRSARRYWEGARARLCPPTPGAALVPQVCQRRRSACALDNAQVSRLGLAALQGSGLLPGHPTPGHSGPLAATAPPPSLPPARLLWAPLGCVENLGPLGGVSTSHLSGARWGVAQWGRKRPLLARARNCKRWVPRRLWPPPEGAQDLVGKRSRGPPGCHKDSGPPATSGGCRRPGRVSAGLSGFPEGPGSARSRPSVCGLQAQRRSRSGRVSRGPGPAGLDRGRRVCPPGGHSWRRGLPPRSSTPGSWAEPSTGRRMEEWAWPRHQLTR